MTRPHAAWSRTAHAPSGRSVHVPTGTHSHSIVPGGLRCDVQHDPVDLAQLVDHPRGDRLQQVVWQPRPVGGHRVVAGHRADRRPRIRRCARRPARRRCARPGARRRTATARGRARPCGSPPAGCGRPRAARPGARLVASPPTTLIARPGPGERLAPDQALGQAELGADGADLVLEQRAQRLDELELQVLGQPADVVVGLDRRRAGAAAGLDHVGVERALDEEARAARRARELARPPPRRRG